jgi:hypothetical protein
MLPPAGSVVKAAYRRTSGIGCTEVGTFDGTAPQMLLFPGARPCSFAFQTFSAARASSPRRRLHDSLVAVSRSGVDDGLPLAAHWSPDDLPAAWQA